jgi:hypothetical protein
MTPVVIHYDDKDRHGAGCDCGYCNSNGHSYGYAIFDATGVELDDDETAEDNWFALISDPDKKLETIYAPSEQSAEAQVRGYCEEQGYEIKE